MNGVLVLVVLKEIQVESTLPAAGNANKSDGGQIDKVVFDSDPHDASFGLAFPFWPTEGSGRTGEGGMVAQPFAAQSHIAAIYREFRAGDETGVVAAEEEDGAGDLAG